MQTNQINGKQIKKGSEPGNRLKTDTVTGKQVRESSLETVPDAANANTLQGQGPDRVRPIRPRGSPRGRRARGAVHQWMDGADRLGG